MSYTQKYLKYKSKYLELKYKMRGGASQSKDMPKDVKVHRRSIEYYVTKSDGSVFCYIEDEEGKARDCKTLVYIDKSTGIILPERIHYNHQEPIDADN